MKPFQAFRNNRSLTADSSSHKKWKKRNDNGSFLRNGEMRTELLDGGSIFYRDWSWDFNLILPFGFNTRPAIKAQPVLNCWKYAKFARPTRSSAKCKMEWGTWTALKKRGIQGKTGSFASTLLKSGKSWLDIVGQQAKHLISDSLCKYESHSFFHTFWFKPINSQFHLQACLWDVNKKSAV